MLPHATSARARSGAGQLSRFEQDDIQPVFGQLVGYRTTFNTATDNDDISILGCRMISRQCQ